MITDFDPRFNNSKPLWFEKLYQPFLRGDLRARWIIYLPLDRIYSGPPRDQPHVVEHWCCIEMLAVLAGQTRRTSPSARL